jgi:phosphatidylserine decarboxylase
MNAPPDSRTPAASPAGELGPGDVIRQRSWFQRLLGWEDLNFLLCNRIPRRLATRCMGWFSKLPTGRLTSISIAIWKLFAPDLDLSEAKQQRFGSLHDCFIRELKPGARGIDGDPEVLTSPCDAIVGAHGRVQGTQVFQAKGFPYTLEDLLADPELVERYRDGCFVTLRLKSSFYHRFHAPAKSSMQRVVYISGDTWNVNPIALKRVERLFCKNERAVLELQLADSAACIAIVAVAAILVASIHLHCLNSPLDLRSQGRNYLTCDAQFAKGDELGYFQHGSTLIVFAPSGFEFSPLVQTGQRIQMGQPLLRCVAGQHIPTRCSDASANQGFCS